MTETKHDPFAALRIGDFRSYITARLFLTIAVNFQAVCVGWQIYDITKDPFSLGLIGLAEAIPYVLIALYAGYIVDHFNRKKILFVAVSTLVVSSSLLFYFSMNSHHIVGKFGTLPVFALIFVTGLARGFISPSMFAVLTQIVPRNLYGNSSTWNSTVWQLGAVSGPALGGLLYGFYGVNNAYLCNIFFFVSSLIFFMLIPAKPHVRPEKKEKISQSISEGLKFVFSNQIMLGALSLDLFAVFFGGAVALLPIFADQVLHVGPQGLGMLRSAPAFGACIMAVILAFKPIKEGAGKILLVSVAIFGLTSIVFALSRNFYLSLVVLAVGGAFDNISVVVRTTIVQLMTPDNMRGRVSSVNSIFIGSSNEIGAFESGFAAKLLGLVPSVIFGGSMTMAVVALTAKFSPKLRKLNLKSDL